MRRGLIIISREKGPTGSARKIVPGLGDGPIFEVPMTQLDAKERPGEYPMQRFFNYRPHE